MPGGTWSAEAGGEIDDEFIRCDRQRIEFHHIADAHAVKKIRFVVAWYTQPAAGEFFGHDGFTH